MHVLVLPSWYPHGPDDVNGSFFREQAHALMRVGCDVGVVTTQLDSIRNLRRVFRSTPRITMEDDDGLLTVRGRGLNVSPRLPGIIRRRWVARGAAAFDAYVARKGIPEIIHAHSMLDAGVLAAAISSRTGIPYVVTEHSTEYARAKVSNADIALVRGIARGAAARIAVSAPFATLLESLLGEFAGSWITVPNIVQREFLERELPDLSQGPDFRFINVALMRAKKGQDDLIRAFAMAFRDAPHVSLTMVGDGPLRAELERLAHGLGVADRVHFTGMLTRADVLRAMAATSALVVSSRYETFGVVVVEALALGKPVVSTRCGGPESILRGGDGLLVKVGDVGELADAMRRIVSDRATYDAREIRKSCADRFGEPVVAASLVKIYEGALNGR